VQRTPRFGPASVIAGCNFGVRRKVFAALDGQSEDMLYAEDVDFGLRAPDLGIEIAYLDDAIVHRRVPATVRTVLRQHYGYGVAQVLIYERHRWRFTTRVPYRRIVRDYAFLVVKAYWLFDEYKRLHWAVVAGQHAGRVMASVRRRVFLP
jgi:GT2 family glycosyltransferase